LALLGLFRLQLDSDPLNLLPADLQSVSTLRQHQELFPSARELLVTVKAETAETAADLAKAIATELARHPDLVESTRWDTGFQESIAETFAWAWAQRPPEDLEALGQRLAPGQVRDALATRREQLATTLDPTEIARFGYDPLGLLDVPGLSGMAALGRTQADPFSSADGTFRVVSVAPRNPAMPYRAAADWLRQISGVVDEVQQRPDLRNGGGAPAVAFTGYVAIMAETANGMERDLTSSVSLTLAVICLLFWVTHRSLKPLGWLVVSLLLTFLVTLSLGAWVLGGLNVISCGFASVMMGLVVDYALVGYQEMRAHPGQPLREIRTAVMPGILWSAATTAGTFLSLRFAGLPGLSELGTLTAMGLVTGAGVTLFWFLPRVAPRTPVGSATSAEVPPVQVPIPAPRARAFAFAGTLALVALGFGVIGLKGWPRIEGASDPLLPRHSASHEAMEALRQELGRTHKTSWLLIRGAGPEAVQTNFAALMPRLEHARRAGEILSFQIPAALWPLPSQARTNLQALGQLAAQREPLRTALREAGYGTNALHLSEAILRRWQRWATSGDGVPTWPDSAFGRWMAPMTSARAADGSWIGRGVLETPSTREGLPALPAGVEAAGWENLGTELLSRVVGRVRVLTTVIILALVVCLWLAFRRWTEVLLGLGSLALSFGLLFTVMSATGATWNLLNLVAIPLILGTSVDSTIHIQLALRRHRGDLRAVWRSTGVALLLCAGANIAGFGSLAWSNNAGLASLDIVCAGGVVCVLIVVLLLLPSWWIALHGETSAPEPQARPSQLYGQRAWQMAIWLARHVGRDSLALVSRIGMRLYLMVRPDRVDQVADNLGPVLGQEDARLLRVARTNCLQFAEKLVDLWRLEAGIRPEVRLGGETEWDSFREAIAARQGVLLVTVHLGNWELGGPLLTDLGIRPLVLSAAEPDAGLTTARAQARASHGVDTLVVGSDPFAFVEVIQRLREGGVVALLLDRPVGTGVETSFFGRSFVASPAAAELARATGARIFPMYIVRDALGPVAHALPEVAYQRADLAGPERRLAFTSHLLATFEDAIRRHPDQWFHFVPVWKSNPTSGGLPSA
ncbi:MAG: MMPL family transporter, partial [Limisphaerales bacterium]